MRDTSKEAYEYICSSGILSKRRTQAYAHLYECGPMTAQELTVDSHVPGLWKRLSELENVHVVKIIGERKCRVTGMTAILWDVTSYRPRRQPPRRAVSWKKRAIAAEAELQRLRVRPDAGVLRPTEPGQSNLFPLVKVTGR